ncbi:MAG: thioredoxin domain-containing protein [bacterium]
MKKVIFGGLLFILIISGCTKQNNEAISVILGLDEAKALALSFINENLVNPGSEVTIKEITEENGLYKIVVTPQTGNDINSYMTLDGKMFFPQGIDIDELAQENEAQEEAAQGTVNAVSKTDQPEVELFVMSFCPYGTLAEDAMSPVVDLLQDKANIKVRYIASVSGDDIDSVKSLHGVIEGKEDARQLCVARDYGQEIFWKYVGAINKDCASLYGDEEKYEECWRGAAVASGVSADKVASCVDKDGASLISAEDVEAQKYNVSGSPTLVINGTISNASRTPEGYKQAICAAFNTEPSECSQTLSSAGGTAEGGCN